MTREEFFNALNTGAKWDVGVSIARTNPLPLDANSVFESLEALTAYATDNPLAYPGQLCSVITETEVAAYQLVSVGTDAVIHKLAASTSTTGDIEGDVKTLQSQVANLLNGDATAKKAEQDADGNVISTTYATKAEVSQIPKFKIQVVAALPTTEISEATIYLVPCTKHDPNDKDTHDEYIYTNNTWEKIGNTDVDLSEYAKTTDVETKISTAVQGLDVAELAVGAGETVKAISETDGKISVTKQDIQIATSQVTGLDNKITELTTLQTRVGADDTTGLSKRIADLETTQTSGVVAEASKVTHKLTAGTKEFDGSADVEITPADLILAGHTETDTERAVKLDESGNAYVTLPAAMLYDVTADGGLEKAVDGNTTSFKVKEGGILTAMIGAAQVTDEKIANVNVNKLIQTEGDSLVLDGGNAAGANSQNN